MVGNQPPWMAALEAQLDALSVVDFLIAHSDQPKAKDLLPAWHVDKRILETAAPFAWAPEATQAVLAASRTIPLDTQMAEWNLSTPTVFWHFQNPLPFSTVTESPGGIRALGFGWLKTRTGLFGRESFGMPCHSWIDDPTKAVSLIPSQVWEWESGQTLGDMLVQTRDHYMRVYGPGGKYEKSNNVGVDMFMAATEGLSRFVLAGLAWLNQKVVVAEAGGHIERHRKKAFERRIGRQPDVRVVQLRKNAYPAHDRVEGESEVEWSCRWAVSGHWRNQARGPKHSERELRYILPYVKGPDDKPFREPGKKVYEVRR